MDFSKAKTIHICCPKCNYDFSYNNKHLVEEIEYCKLTIANCIKLKNVLKDQYGKKASQMPKYKRLDKEIAETNCNLIAYKKARAAVIENIDQQLNRMFLQKIKAEIGEEKYIKLKEECEEELQYNSIYGVGAVQKYNRFSGI